MQTNIYFITDTLKGVKFSFTPLIEYSSENEQAIQVIPTKCVHEM